jgi:hypothetical protein
LNGGAGTPSVFDLQGNVNVINNDEQLSAIGGANNTNRQNFSQLPRIFYDALLAISIITVNYIWHVNKSINQVMLTLEFFN